MQPVTGVFDEQRLIGRPKGAIVKAGMGGIAAIDHGDLAFRGGRCGLRELEHGAEPAIFGSRFGGGIGIAGLIEQELGEFCAGPKQAVLGALERTRACRLGELVGVEGRVSIPVGIVQEHPLGLERHAITVKVHHAPRFGVGISFAAMEHDGVARGVHDL